MDTDVFLQIKWIKKRKEKTHMFNFFTSSLPGFVHAVCQGSSELFMYLHSFM